jgi:hypothetical protein
MASAPSSDTVCERKYMACSGNCAVMARTSGQSFFKSADAIRAAAACVSIGRDIVVDFVWDRKLPADCLGTVSLTVTFAQ